ncbi:hypothetical protein E0Z10_g2808 [Xylaria hypoxylon]|uniref:Uncharacterized protein n=1 Tax=Xylaria hypoxylon TaxID=37992 RepID=A0A4Z0Z571_9PEZI|nr:hypothetical protein E0Z10_g2808 [Xylaria hypoxylon]
MIQGEAHESGYSRHQNTPTSSISRYQSSPPVPVTPVVGTWGQPRGFHNTISQSNRKELKYKDEHACSTSKRPMEQETSSAGDQHLTDKISIGQPLPLSGRPPPEPMRTPSRLSFISFPQYTAQESRAMSNSPQINPHNLDLAHEALHSHPGSPQHPGSPRSHKAIKAQNRKFAIYGDQFFSAKTPGVMLEQFPGSDSCETNGGEQSVVKAVDSAIPIIRLIPPPEGNVQQIDKWRRRLSTSDAYKSLHGKSERENRMLRRLLPLAWLTAEAEGTETNDASVLVEALKDIIEDRKRLTDLLPLAAALCAEQGIKFNTDAFETLPRTLDKVLADVKRAKYAAGHHKRARKELERRVSQLESELSRCRYGGDEDYVR